MDDPFDCVLMRVISGLKVALTVTVYFSICALIILLILGAEL